MALKLCLTWNNHMNMMNEFSNFLLSEDMVDVTLSCGGQILKAHKLILSACSPFFKALFNGNPCKHPIVIFNDMKYSDLKAIIEYIYFGKVKVAIENLPTLMKIAQTLKVKGLGDLKSKKKRSDNEFQSQPTDELENQSEDETGNQLTNEVDNQSEDELENQPEDESGNQTTNEVDNQSEDELENQPEGELENQPGCELENQPVDETVYGSVVRVDVSNCKLTQGQLASYDNDDGTYERQFKQEVLDDDDDITFKTMFLQSQNTNSSYRILKTEPLEQCADASPALVESSKNSTSSILKQILTVGDIPKQSCQSSIQSNTDLQQNSLDNFCSLVPVTSLYMSPDGSVVGCREAGVSPACKKVELKNTQRKTVKKRPNPGKPDINDSSNSKPKKDFKKVKLSEKTDGKVKSLTCNSGSFEAQHSNNCMVVDQTNPNLKQFNCSDCTYTTPIIKNFLLHVEIHKRNKSKLEQIYSCDMCPYNTSKKDYLKSHLRRKHKIIIKNCMKNLKCMIKDKT